jgi:hypothetical protein
MKLWAWVSCYWCGFMGCAAPIGDGCPQCGHRLEETLPRKRGQTAAA